MSNYIRTTIPDLIILKTIFLLFVFDLTVDFQGYEEFKFHLVSVQEGNFLNLTKISKTV